jgi:hypothetical protein
VRSTSSKLCRWLALCGAVAGMLAAAAPAAGQTGGSPTPGASATITTTGKPGKARLTKTGKAIPPSNAPAAVVSAITAANSIRRFPYRYGGGHASFYDSGYDCSGAVSFVLNAAGMLDSPLPSGPLASSWGVPGKGRWITVFANGGHAYAVIAGLRWDTSAVGESLRRGSGPRWRATKRRPKGYAVKHYDGY